MEKIVDTNEAYPVMSGNRPNYPVSQVANFVNPAEVIGLASGIGGLLVGDGTGGIASVNPAVTGSSVNAGQILYTDNNETKKYAFLAPGASNELMQINSMTGLPEYTDSLTITTLNLGASNNITTDGDNLVITTAGSAYIGDVVADNKVATILDITNHNASINVLDACLVMLSGPSIDDTEPDSMFTSPVKAISGSTGIATLLYNPNADTSLAQIIVQQANIPNPLSEYNLTYNDINGVTQYILDNARVMINLNYVPFGANTGSQINGIYIYHAYDAVAEPPIPPYFTRVPQASTIGVDINTDIAVGMYSFVQASVPFASYSYVISQVVDTVTTYTAEKTIFVLYDISGLNVPGTNQLIATVNGAMFNPNGVDILESEPNVSGYDTLSVDNSINVGDSSLNNSTLTTLFLQKAGSTNTISIGEVLDDNSVSFGTDAYAGSDNSVAIGYGAVVDTDCSNSVAIGTGSACLDINTIAIGGTGDGDIKFASASVSDSIAIGTSAGASGISAISIGGTGLDDVYYNVAGGDYSISIGAYSNASAFASIAIGQNSNVTGASSVAINSVPSDDPSIPTNTVSGSSSFVVLNLLPVVHDNVSVIPASILVSDDTNGTDGTYSFVNNTSAVNCLSTPVFDNNTFSTSAQRNITLPADSLLSVNSFKMICLKEALADTDRSVTLRGSDNSSSWVDIVANASMANSYSIGDCKVVLSFSNKTTYRYYKIVLNVNSAGTQSGVFRPLLEGILIDTYVPPDDVKKFLDFKTIINEKKSIKNVRKNKLMDKVKSKKEVVVRKQELVNKRTVKKEKSLLLECKKEIVDIRKEVIDTKNDVVAEKQLIVEDKKELNEEKSLIAEEKKEEPIKVRDNNVGLFGWLFSKDSASKDSASKEVIPVELPKINISELIKEEIKN